MKNLKREKQKGIIKVCFFAIIVILAGIIYISYYSLKPLIISNIEVCAENEFLNITAKELENIIKENNINYKELANIEKNNNGDIISVSCNTVKLTNIKTELIKNIDVYLKKEPEFSFSIPLGNVLNSNLFSGKGPCLKYKYVLSSTINSDFKSEFKSAGINQTLHKIVLELSSDISASMPYITSNINVKSSYILAETVIVGKIPQSYFSIN